MKIEKPQKSSAYEKQMKEKVVYERNLNGLRKLFLYYARFYYARKLRCFEESSSCVFQMAHNMFYIL